MALPDETVKREERANVEMASVKVAMPPLTESDDESDNVTVPEAATEPPPRMVTAEVLTAEKVVPNSESKLPPVVMLNVLPASCKPAATWRLTLPPTRDTCELRAVALDESVKIHPPPPRIESTLRLLMSACAAFCMTTELETLAVEASSDSCAALAMLTPPSVTISCAPLENEATAEP